MPWTAGPHHVAGFELETGDVIDACPMNLIVDYSLNFQTPIHFSKAHYIQLQHTMSSGGYANS